MSSHQMNTEELWAFLSGIPAHTAKLATTRKDGSPHVAPIWYTVDGETLVFMTHRDSLKGRNLRRDPRVALCVDDERPPFSFAIVEGTVEISDDGDETELVHWATVIGGRYMGQDQADSYGKRNGVPGYLLVRLRPHKFAAAADIAL